MQKQEDFIELYLKYTEQTECPTFFHRWTAVTSLGAYLGRQVFFRHGHFTLHPNTFTMLIGSPGTKKSSAIKIGAKLLKQAGYDTFAAKKTRQEKFLIDLADQSKNSEATESLDNILDVNLWGEDEASVSSKPPAECYVAADEFTNFIGMGNLDFLSLLGELWDYEGVYDYKLKNSESVYIPNPTISILGGTTPTMFAQAFPPESIGQGFFSRLLLIHGVPSGVKYTFPPPPDLEVQAQLVKLLHKIKATISGEIAMTPEATELLDRIYKTWPGLDDPRFESYANRRLTHLLKLCLIMSASKLRSSIDVEVVIEANTLLTFTEQLMPKALGEFGKARNSDVAHKVMSLVDAAMQPLRFVDIWRHVHTDLEDRNQLVQIIGNLLTADKIQEAGGGYLPKKKLRGAGIKGAVNWELLTKDERDLI